MSSAIKTILMSSTLFAVTPGLVIGAEPLTIYGKMNISVQQNDEQKLYNNKIEGFENTEIRSNGSRLGIMGDFELGHDISAFYKIEYGIDTQIADKNNFKARNQYVGLKGNFGAVAVGRNDTALKKSQGKVDLFESLEGDIKNLFKGENRLAQTASYYSPTFDHASFAVTYVAESDEAQFKAASKPNHTTLKGESGVSTALLYGDPKLKKIPIYAALAFDFKVNGYDIIRVSAKGRIAGFDLGAMYQEQEKDVDGSEKHSGYLLSGSYRFLDFVYKLQYQHIDGGITSKWSTNDNKKYTELTSYSAGVDYFLAKSTKVFGFYTAKDYEDLNNNDQYFAVGIEHKF